MAIAGVINYTLTDAEFLAINGAAAPTITVVSPLYAIGATATSGSGTTTITLPSGKRSSNSIKRLVDIMRRAATSYRITETV